MSELTSQHQARKARLQRFAEAASRYNSKQSAPADVMQIDLLEKAIQRQPEEARTKVTRRQYEKPDQPSVFAPVLIKILRAVADEFGMTIEDIRAQNREKKFTVPRYVAIGLMIELTRLSLPAIGRQLGGRDHTTIIAGRRRFYELVDSEAFRNRLDQIKASIIA